MSPNTDKELVARATRRRHGAEGSDRKAIIIFERKTIKSMQLFESVSFE
jgi:hypothetical protein